MSDERDVSRRSTLKSIATGAALGLGVVAASSTAAADDCHYIQSCADRCPEGVWVVTYECCGDFDDLSDCNVHSKYCGMCP